MKALIPIVIGLLFVERGIGLSHLWTQSEKSHKPTDSNWDSVEKSGMCFGNRTQQHRIPCFLWKYSYHTNLTENPERPNSPNV